MTALLTECVPTLTIADMMDRFGPMPLHRIRFDPWPGNATEDDVLELHERENRLFELIDGILVEKTVGFPESLLAAFIVRLIGNFIEGKRLGMVAGADGIIRLRPGMVRIPDGAFFAASRFTSSPGSLEPVPMLAPDLAIEVLSLNNTKKEMENKREDYFSAGCKLVWEVDRETRTVTVYTSPDRFICLQESDTLDGGDVLSGFTLPVRRIFAHLEEIT